MPTERGLIPAQLIDASSKISQLIHFIGFMQFEKAIGVTIRRCGAVPHERRGSHVALHSATAREFARRRAQWTDWAPG